MNNTLIYYFRGIHFVKKVFFFSLSTNRVTVQAIGTDALSREGSTMNFGWLTPTTPNEEYSRVVIHEFGHVLGCIHEHQSPVSSICWNEQAVIDYFRNTQGWDEPTTRFNVLEKESPIGTNFSAFDRNSIMLYFFHRN